MLDGLKTAGGGIEVVGDLTVADISTTSGFNTMMSALQTHHDIKVVLGGDTIVVGAYKALKESGKLTDDMFLSGVDGDKEALELIKAGGAYKLSIAFAWTLMGYGLGQFGADWIEGKQVPRVIVAKGVQLGLRRGGESASQPPAPTRRACSPTAAVRGLPAAVRQRQPRHPAHLLDLTRRPAFHLRR